MLIMEYLYELSEIIKYGELYSCNGKKKLSVIHWTVCVMRAHFLKFSVSLMLINELPVNLL